MSGYNWYASRAHCSKGHEYAPENTWIRKEAWRVCRNCRNIYGRKQVRRKLTDSEVLEKLKSPETLLKFESKIKRGVDCWEWIGSKLRGYGILSMGFKFQFPAHRASLLLKIGFIDSGLMALHRCSNKGCVNPDHLYAGNKRQNALDAIRDGSHPYAIATHCKSGHEYTKENTKIMKAKSGFVRRCRACLKRYAEDRAARASMDTTGSPVNVEKNSITTNASA